MVFKVHDLSEDDILEMYESILDDFSGEQDAPMRISILLDLIASVIQCQLGYEKLAERVKHVEVPF